MNKLFAKFVIALVILGGIPSFGLAKTSPLFETITENSTTNAGRFRLYANSYVFHDVFLNRGYATIVLEGDGDTDLDLYVYNNTGLIAKSECSCDYEEIHLNIHQSGYFKVQVVNRGKVYNDYSLYVR